jgi:hypothetical protein
LEPAIVGSGFGLRDVNDLKLEEGGGRAYLEKKSPETIGSILD